MIGALGPESLYQKVGLGAHAWSGTSIVSKTAACGIQ